VLSREDYHSSPAIRAIADKLRADTGWTPADMDFFDLYSCFPVAVQMTRDMFGISEDDDRCLTVTGGLPYFGGPGNNYVMHAIAEMVEVLRKHPGRRGLVTGNSFYLTRHCAAIYSTAPLAGACWRSGLTDCQRAVDRRPRPKIAADPTGVGRVETYTVIFDQNGRPEMGLLIGRTEDDQRFAAYTPKDMDLLTAMTSEDFYGVRGNVTREGMVNTFVPL
jgi:acetyl-CoA C-acetyltransferase